MNKIYKVLWSEAKQAYVVVSELAKNHGKKSQSKLAVLMLAAAVFCQAKIPTFIMKIPHRHQGNFPTFSEDIRMRFSQPHPAA